MVIKQINLYDPNTNQVVSTIDIGANGENVTITDSSGRISSTNINGALAEILALIGSGGGTAISDIAGLQTVLDNKQDKLSAGNNIIISPEGVISVASGLGYSVPKMKNNPLPAGKGELRILSIGNSHTRYPSKYVPYIVNAAGIDKTKLCWYILYQGSSSLEYWAGIYEGGTNRALEDTNVGTLSISRTSGTMAELLSQDWDVITLQQVSTNLYDYNTFEPYLTTLINAIKRHCPKAAIAWQFGWQDSDYFNPNGGIINYSNKFNSIIDAVKKVVALNGIDIIIPSGMAIENARFTSLNIDNYNLTEDTNHLAAGVGKYIGAGTWFQTLIAPVFNKSFYGDTTKQSDYGETSTNHLNPVTESNRTLCQECVMAAVADMWNITQVEQSS